MNVRFLSLARAEMDDAFAWYEDQAVGLGYEFLDALDQAVRLITSFPNSHQLAGKNLRRCLLNRFPYALYYGIDQGGIIVVAVAHLRRNPHYWVGRVM